MIAIPNMEKPKNAFNCSIKINPEERRCIYTGKVFEETLSLLIDRPCDDCPLIETAEPKVGKWLDAGWDGEKCSLCGYSISDTYYSAQFNYCPNCGAKMERSE